MEKHSTKATRKAQYLKALEQIAMGTLKHLCCALKSTLSGGTYSGSYERMLKDYFPEMFLFASSSDSVNTPTDYWNIGSVTPSKYKAKALRLTLLCFCIAMCSESDAKKKRVLPAKLLPIDTPGKAYHNASLIMGSSAKKTKKKKIAKII